MAKARHIKNAARKKRQRQARCERLRKWREPLVEFCDEHDIELEEGVDYFIFRKQEYVVTWRLPTNGITVQYRGESEPTTFQTEAQMLRFPGGVYPSDVRFVVLR